MGEFVIETFHDHMRMQTIVRLRRGIESVEVIVTDEVMVDSHSPYDVMKDALKMLAEAWMRKYGAQVYFRPPRAEAHPWAAHDGDYVDGEVIEDEERRAIDAPRKAIEGRRH